MKLLTYDCGLENKSFEIATYNSYVQSQFDSVLREWMQTAQPFDFTNSLNISYHNASEIPFLQIVHGPTTKVGCAFHVCPKTEDSLMMRISLPPTAICRLFAHMGNRKT
ncbi:hypothetical protein KIN20_035963 [Parelaphostrongylus tenuis]|uniref:SCP domain-containing protein n=1 Tax=Parelaphostrongylus tenuis TaxID=148309 RepID=A0AAD5RFF7_PARTN|nr:hypothetical protein KIN20_035963 [Parelaphostrongylus tenuis]